MSKTNNGANLGFENKLWEMADKMRGHMDSGEYKHVALGLIFLKYISDAFQSKYDALKATAESDYTDPEDRDEYAAANIFWVPKDARWEKIQAEAKQPTIGKIIDDAMAAIEKENPTLKGVLPKDYSRPALDKHRLGELVDIIGNVDLQAKKTKRSNAHCQPAGLRRRRICATDGFRRRKRLTLLLFMNRKLNTEPHVSLATGVSAGYAGQSDRAGAGTGDGAL